MLRDCPRLNNESHNQTEQHSEKDDAEIGANGTDNNAEEDAEMFDATQCSKSKAYWTYDLTITLINKYKAYYPLFKDSIHTNVAVWDMISSEFIDDGFAFSGDQCENRWKYIRAKYIKKKDNSADHNTGAAAYRFEYFDELDEILGKQPNVIPKYVASSSKAIRSSHPTSSSTKGSSSIASTKPSSASKAIRSPRPKKNSSAVFDQEITDTSNLSMFVSDAGHTLEDEEREFGCGSPDNTPGNTPKGKQKKEPWEESVSRQERYHADMMEMQRESLSVFKDVMLKVVEKFSEASSSK